MDFYSDNMFRWFESDADTVKMTFSANYGTLAVNRSDNGNVCNAIDACGNIMFGCGYGMTGMGRTCFNSILGGQASSISSSAKNSVIGGGSSHVLQGNCSIIGGGLRNCIEIGNTSDNFNAILGGCENKIYNSNVGGNSNTHHSIVGGCLNVISSSAAVGHFIGGGACNIINAGTQSYASIVGGLQNTIQGSYSSGNIIGAGMCNLICSCACLSGLFAGMSMK